jgi:hypothetical protein
MADGEFEPKSSNGKLESDKRPRGRQATKPNKKLKRTPSKQPQPSNVEASNNATTQPSYPPRLWDADGYGNPVKPTTNTVVRVQDACEEALSHQETRRDKYQYAADAVTDTESSRIEIALIVNELNYMALRKDQLEQFLKVKKDALLASEDIQKTPSEIVRSIGHFAPRDSDSTTDVAREKPIAPREYSADVVNGATPRPEISALPCDSSKISGPSRNPIFERTKAQLELPLEKTVLPPISDLIKVSHRIHLYPVEM